MKKLNTRLLVEAYYHAIELNLSKEFIKLLRDEILIRYPEHEDLFLVLNLNKL
ncbi:sporulation histidine kinase inhibitor Sda [Neobacillus niacini]|uniref:sporulation histidine kinase inhibitor Sda n=1 Tax=Neobacillus niacini TaxID=86668 RepID=UPI002FFD5E3C